MSARISQNDNLRASMLMIVAMAGFAIEDALMKLLSGSISVGVLIIMVGLFSTTIMSVTAVIRRAPLFSRDFFHPAVLIRNLCEMLGAVGFVTALMLLPLQITSALFQTLPLAITVGAAAFLGEEVGWRRWSAVVVGLVGVLIILRPTGEDFEILPACACLLAVVALAGRDLATRRIPAHVNSGSLAAWGMFAYFLSGVILLPFGNHGFEIPQGSDLGLLLVIAIVGLIAYLLLIAASRIGEISAIIPFRYTRLLFALFLGWTLFDEVPDFWMLVGSALIVGSGFYTFVRERYHASKAKA